MRRRGGAGRRSLWLAAARADTSITDTEADLDAALAELVRYAQAGAA